MTFILCFFFVLVCIAVGVPVLYIACLMSAAHEKAAAADRKAEIDYQLKLARIRSISNGDMPLKSARLAKLDSEIAMLELKIQEKRTELGLDSPDFIPENYGRN
jgi:hypothetical protein